MKPICPASFVRRRWVLVTVALILVGAVGYFLWRHPQRAGPELDLRVRVPNRSSGEIERDVTDVFERACSQVPHVARVRSLTEDGQTSLTLELEPGARVEDTVSEVAKAAQDTETALRLPAGSSTVARAGGNVAGRYAWSTPNSMVDDFVQASVVPALSRLPGVESVVLCGGTAGELHIDITDMYSLRVGRITLAELVASIRSWSPPSDDPYLRWTPTGRLSIYLAHVRLGTGPTGEGMYLEDVAKVSSEAPRPHCRAWSQSGPVEEAVVRGSPGADAVAIRIAVGERLREVYSVAAPAAFPEPVDAADEILVDLNPVENADAYGALREAVLDVLPKRGVGALVEVGDPDGAPGTVPSVARVLLEWSGDKGLVGAVVRRLKAVPFVRSAGVPNATIELIGPDRSALDLAAHDLLLRLEQRDELVARLAGNEREEPSVYVINDIEVGRYGIDRADLEFQLSLLRGRVVVSERIGDRTIPVVVHVEGTDHVYETKGGFPVPIDRLAKAALDTAPPVLVRDGRRPMVGARIQTTDLAGVARAYVPPPGIELRVIPDRAQEARHGR
jgi:multidrug efflux pump subunit AcrB